jgi:hypothetical protein
MASWNSTVDGLGFEEVNQSGQTEIISGTNVYGTTGSFVNLNTTNIKSSNIEDTNGELRSNLIGSATTNVYGGFIQTGSLLTSAGSQGFIKLGTPYTSATSWYAVVSPCGSATGFEKWYLSGLRNASGVNFVGAASLRYDFIAVGL